MATLFELIEHIDTKTALQIIKEDNKPTEQIQMKTRTLNQFKNLFSVWIEPTTEEFLDSMHHFIPLEDKTNYWIHKKTITKKGSYKHYLTYTGPFLSKYHIGGSVTYDNLDDIEMTVRYGHEIIHSKKQPPKKLTEKETEDLKEAMRLGKFISTTVLSLFIGQIVAMSIYSNIQTYKQTINYFNSVQVEQAQKEIEDIRKIHPSERSIHKVIGLYRAIKEYENNTLKQNKE